MKISSLWHRVIGHIQFNRGFASAWHGGRAWTRAGYKPLYQWRLGAGPVKVQAGREATSAVRLVAYRMAQSLGGCPALMLQVHRVAVVAYWDSTGARRA